MNTGKVFVISGPSGVGKDTIVEAILYFIPSLVYSISSTVRDIRNPNKDNNKYNFISTQEFERMITNGEFLEYNIYNGNFYGTPKAPVIDAINNGKDILVEVDVNGAYQIKKAIPGCITIFILPPSIEELKRRLIERNEDSFDKILERLEQAKEEIPRADEFDYKVLNDELDKTIKECLDIIREEQNKDC